MFNTPPIDDNRTYSSNRLTSVVATFRSVAGAEAEEQGLFLFEAPAEAEAFVRQVNDLGGYASIIYKRQPFQFLEVIQEQQERLQELRDRIRR